jgi:hypothetical protein
MVRHNIEQNTELWDELRQGRITASQAHTLFMKPTTEGYKDYVFKIAYEKLFGEPAPEKFNGNFETEEGHRKELLAKERYEELTFSKVHPGGFWELDEWVGCSPDGVVGEDGLVEIKSTITAKSYRKLVEGNFKAKTEHYEQCMFQMYVTGRKWVDLIYFPPTDKARIIINKIERDEGQMEKLHEAIESFKQAVEAQMETLKVYQQ